MRRCMLPLLLIGCAAEAPRVVLSGRITDSTDPASDPIPSADLQSFDETASPVGSATTDAVGLFEVELTSGAAFFLVIDAADQVPTSFSGRVGTTDVAAEDGTLWSRSTQEQADIEQAFDGCPGLGSGATIEGEVRVYLAVEDGDTTLPLVNNAEVWAVDSNGDTRPACYLDDNGTYDETGIVTGDSGRFAIFGVPEGLTQITATYAFSEDLQPEAVYWVYAPADGAVPLYPAYVPLP